MGVTKRELRKQNHGHWLCTLKHRLRDLSVIGSIEAVIEAQYLMRRSNLRILRVAVNDLLSRGGLERVGV